MRVSLPPSQPCSPGQKVPLEPLHLPSHSTLPHPSPHKSLRRQTPSPNKAPYQLGKHPRNNKHPAPHKRMLIYSTDPSNEHAYHGAIVKQMKSSYLPTFLPSMRPFSKTPFPKPIFESSHPHNTSLHHSITTLPVDNIDNPPSLKVKSR